MSRNEETELSWLQGLSKDEEPSTTREDLVEARWAAGAAAQAKAEQDDTEHVHEEARENHDEWLRSLGETVVPDDETAVTEPVLVEDEDEQLESTGDNGTTAEQTALLGAVVPVEQTEAQYGEAAEQSAVPGTAEHGGDDTVAAEVADTAGDRTVAGEAVADKTGVVEHVADDTAGVEAVADETAVVEHVADEHVSDETVADGTADEDTVADGSVVEVTAVETAVVESVTDGAVDTSASEVEDGTTDDAVFATAAAAPVPETAGSTNEAEAEAEAAADAEADVADPGTAAAPVKKSRWRKPAIIASAATVLVLGAGGGIALALTKEITVQADGRTVTVSTFAGDVAGALAAAQIDVGQYDEVTPAVSDPIGHQDTIVVDRARLVTVSLDGDLHQTWTTAETLDVALGELGVQAGAGEQLELSADLQAAIPADGLQVEAAITFPVTLTDGATAAQQLRTDVDTVADLLAAQEVELGELDVITPAVTAALAPGDSIKIDRVAVTSVTEQAEVAQPADTSVEDPALAQGLTEVAEAGNPGTEAVTFQVTTVDGVETERVETAREVQVAAKASVVRIGTRVPDPAEKYADPSTWSTNWDGIARCESTNNWAINTGNGYYGGLQFDRGTWLGAGGGVYGATANLATKEQQIYIAEKVYASRGLSPWACGHAG